jgi:gliding motility-associated-like protein
MITQVSVSGKPPVFVQYTHNCIADSLFSNEDNVMELHLSDTGYYHVIRYGDSTQTVTSSKTIHVNAYPPVALLLEGGGIYCNYDDPIPITANFEGTPPFTLTYLSGNEPHTITTDQFTYSFEDTLNFSMEARVVEDKYCTIETRQFASVKMIKIPKPPIFGDTLICLYKNSLYTSQTEGFTPQWEIPTGARLREGITSNGRFVAITWVVPGNHTVNLKLTDLGSGCESPTNIYRVEVLDQPSVRKYFDTIVCFDFENEIHIALNTKPGETVFWPELNQFGTSANLFETGFFSYIVTDMHSCSDTGFVSLTEVCIPEFHVPEAFTPNGDNLNDFLEIFGVYFNLKFSIYSPSGQELFYTEDNSEYWDGTCNGKDLPNGRYYWHADYTDKYGTQYSRSGYIMLIR